MEVTRAIRNLANKQRGGVPIIALSADADVKRQAMFVTPSMDAVVGKPLLIEVLEKELKRILKLS